MSITGSAGLRILQNEHTPILDLLVRESIQNSLDAQDNKDFVQVDYCIGEFQQERLVSKFEGIKDGLNSRPERTFLAIRDSNTVGLTGHINKEDVCDGNYGNFIKLVYDMLKPQEIQGAGGSWGVGKTIYFRIGIGLVIYYSRIKVGEKYESRLAACLMEDEKSPNAIIPLYEGRTRSGIAWFGKELRANKTIPIGDEEYIRDFLSIFNLSPYEGAETGTTVIIPYTNEEKLLKHGQLEYEQGNSSIIPFWRFSLNDYLKIAVQRWYFPRLNNPLYQYGVFLKARINGENIKPGDMLPIFRLQQALYNRAAGADVTKGIYDFIEENNCTSGIDAVKLNGIEYREVGKVAYAKVTREVLGMCPPSNHYHPNMYMNLDIADYEKNSPVLSFCRKPGMVVAHVCNDNEWLYNVPSTDSDEFIVAFFALNSGNKVSGNGWNGLEEYVRKCELSDHTTWNDNGSLCDSGILLRTKKGTAKKMQAAFVESKVIDSVTQDVKLGKLFANLLLPPEGFGRNATSSSPGNNPTPSRSSYLGHGNIKYRLLSTKYTTKGMRLTFDLIAKKAKDNFDFGVSIASESKPLSLESWESDYKLGVPFKITECHIEFVSLNKQQFLEEYGIDDTKQVENNGLIHLEFLKTSLSKSSYGVRVKLDSEYSFHLKLNLELEVFSKEIRPIFNFI